MKITILGCGASPGVPVVGIGWGECDPNDSRNRRSRASILLQFNGKNILIDTSSDLREQLLRHNINRIDAVVYTHAHADHVDGIVELRPLCFIDNKLIPIYASPKTLAEIKTRFYFLFNETPYIILDPHIISDKFELFGLEFLPFSQNHGPSDSLGFRIGDFAYSTDVKAFPAESLQLLAGVKTWIVDCLRISPNATHAHLAQTLEWIEIIKPQRAILTHMDLTLDYKKINAILPTGVELAYDGMSFLCDMPEL